MIVRSAASGPRFGDLPDGRSWESVAFHEAGHAVVAIVSGIGLESVDLIPGADLEERRDWWGNCTVSAGPAYLSDPSASLDDAGREWLRGRMLVLCSGLAAEELIGARDDIGGIDDHGLAIACALRLADGDQVSAADLCERAQSEAGRMVREHAEWIERVARLLLETGVASAEAVLAARDGSPSGEE